MTGASDWTAVNAWASAAAPAAALVLMRTTAVLAVAWGLAWLLRRGAAEARVLVARAGLVSAVLVAAISVLVGSHVPAAAPLALTLPPPARQRPAALVAPMASTDASTPREVARSSSLRGVPMPGPAAVLLALWLGGTIVLLGWLALCRRAVGGLRLRASEVTGGPAASELRELAGRTGVPAPLLLASSDARAPFLSGTRRPAIVVPAALLGNGRSRRPVLAHELAHLARKDRHWLAASRLACALLWPQPLVWLAARQMARASEEACDEAVVRDACAARDYAECLLTVARTMRPRRAERALCEGVVPFRSDVGRRIQRVLQPDAGSRRAVPRGARAAAWVAVGLAASACLLVFGAAPQPTMADGAALAAVEFEGRVLRADGRPAVGVRVMAQVWSREIVGPQPIDLAISWAEATTRADGSYRLTGLGPRMYNVAVEERSGQWVAAAVSVRGRPGRAVQVAPIRLSRGGFVEVRVTDASDGRPVEGAPIGCYGPQRPRSSAMCTMVKTDPRGRATFRVASGASYVYVALADYAIEGRGRTVRVAEGAKASASFRIDRRRVGGTP